MKHDLKEIGRNFCLHGDFVSAAPYGSGHINDTYAAVYDQGGNRIRYIHQRLNHNIFKDTVSLMENIRRVTEHVRGKLQAAGAEQISRRVLTLIPARDGKCYCQDADGNTWRTYIFIENAQTYDVIENAEQAYHAAKAYGNFQKQLADLPAPRLLETIPDFHHTPARYQALLKTIEQDPCNRAVETKAEIEHLLARESFFSRLVERQAKGEIPERITHNDTKLNNVMLDDENGSGVCVIDLDTVMPGLTLYDFGDMVRSATNPAREDSTEPALAQMQMPMFQALARGYLESAGEFLNKAEIEELAFSGILITLEIGIRFLTDYLAGDTYFKTRRPGQNLDRCRVHLNLAQSMENQLDAMNNYVDQQVNP
jgi:aminoglycoside phosphotransferase (APT) family kinase protein